MKTIIYCLLISFALASCAKEEITLPEPVVTARPVFTFAGDYTGRMYYQFINGDTSSVLTERHIFLVDSYTLLVKWYAWDCDPVIAGQTRVYNNTYTYWTIKVPFLTSCGISAMYFKGSGILEGDTLSETGTGTYYIGNTNTTFNWQGRFTRQ